MRVGALQLVNVHIACAGLYLGVFHLESQLLGQGVLLGGGHHEHVAARRCEVVAHDVVGILRPGLTIALHQLHGHIDAIEHGQVVEGAVFQLRDGVAIDIDIHQALATLEALVVHLL